MHRSNHTPTLLLWTALLGAASLGVWMRWSMTGAFALALPFEHVRHAHSHLGYFGLLFPLAWLGWAAAGAKAPGAGALTAYLVFNAVAFVGFLTAGYGPVAIAGSTAISAVWLWSAGPLVGRMRDLKDPLGAVPLGIVLSLACVPPIALTLRTQPEVAQGFVSTFLSGLLFLVVVPSALAGRRISPGPWPAFLAAGALGALALGAAPNLGTRAGLLGYAALLAAPVLSDRLPTPTRAAWAPVAAGLVMMALGILPNIRPVALGAIHFLILGPVLATLAVHWLPRAIPDTAWWVGHSLWGAMSGALVAQAFTPARWTWWVAAIGGTGTLLWWAFVLVRSAGPAPPPDTAPTPR